MAVSILFLGNVFLGCNTNYMPKPISSKTTDLKTYRFENGKLIHKEPVFKITHYEYEKTEDERELEFVQWKPEPLMVKTKLTKFWEKNISKQYYIYPKPIPEGWSLYTHSGLEIVIDTKTGGSLDLFSGGDILKPKTSCRWDIQNISMIMHALIENQKNCYGHILEREIFIMLLIMESTPLKM